MTTRLHLRLVRGATRDDEPSNSAAPAAPPKLVLLSPGSTRWLPTLGDALGPSYRVVSGSYETPAAIVVDSRDDDLARLVQDQRSSTRVIVVHTGHPSEQPMAPAEILDLGADAYLAPASLPALAAHVKALTRSWDAFPPRTPPHPARQTA
jgi:hypothetical protein